MSALIDLTGQVIGEWTVIARAENNVRGQTRWLCRCSCSTERVVYGGDLRGRVGGISCGHLKQLAHNFIDLTGNTYGEWVVLYRVDNNERGQAHWLCRCSCLKERAVFGANLRNGSSISCGHGGNNSATTHGLSGTSAYASWKDMRRRCLKPYRADYDRYGGRGITICPEWADFAVFYADMGERPEGKTLDRINNDGNYEPGNCKWSTVVEQNNNRRPRRKRVP